MRLKIANSTTRRLKLWVEPWAHDYTVEAGVTAEVVAENPGLECIEVVCEEDGEITLHVNAERVRVLVNGEEREPDFDDG